MHEHDHALASDLPPDVRGSTLFNADLAPVPPERRTWSTYNFAALWISMAHCIPTYMLAGGLIAVGMNWWQALLTIGLGNLIVLVPILLNAHPGTRYGIPFPVLARASFGTRGANVPAILRALVACGWFGIQTYIGGEAVRTFLTVLWPGFAGLGGEVRILGLGVPSALTFALFWAVNIAIIYRGMNAVRLFENWAAPVLFVMALALLVWAVGRAGGLGSLLTRPSRFGTLAEFWPVFVPSLTGMIGFWATLSLNIPDFTRFGRGQKEQVLGQALGLPAAMIGLSAIAVVITSAAQDLLSGADEAFLASLWNPTVLLAELTSSSAAPGLAAPLIGSAGTRAIVALLALAGISVATISTNIAANVVSPANDFANLAPRVISFKTGGLITGLLGIAMMPWKLLESADTYIFDWLIGYSALLGPIAGIMIVDYWIVRGRELDVADLYRERGRYAGVNKVALLALAAGVLPNLPGFLASVGVLAAASPFWGTLYTYAWFSGFAIAGLLYGLVSAARPRHSAATT